MKCANITWDFVENRLEKSVFQLSWMRMTRSGMKYFPSPSLATSYQFSGTHMYNLCKSGLHISLPMQFWNICQPKNSIVFINITHVSFPVFMNTLFGWSERSNRKWNFFFFLVQVSFMTSLSLRCTISFASFYVLFCWGIGECLLIPGLNTPSRWLLL